MATAPEGTLTPSEQTLQEDTEDEYKWGFVTDIEAYEAQPGLSEDIIR